MRKSSTIRAFFLLSFVAFLPSNSFGSIQSAHQNVDFLRFDSMDQNRSLRTPRQQQNSNSNSPTSSPEQIMVNPSNSASSAPLFQPINNDLPSPQAIDDGHSLSFHIPLFSVKIIAKGQRGNGQGNILHKFVVGKIGISRQFGQSTTGPTEGDSSSTHTCPLSIRWFWLTWCRFGIKSHWFAGSHLDLRGWLNFMFFFSGPGQRSNPGVSPNPGSWFCWAPGCANRAWGEHNSGPFQFQLYCWPIGPSNDSAHK